MIVLPLAITRVKYSAGYQPENCSRGGDGCTGRAVRGGRQDHHLQSYSSIYDIREGSISIDGIDIRNYTQRSLRQNIGIVQQDVYLFPGR